MIVLVIALVLVLVGLGVALNIQLRRVDGLEHELAAERTARSGVQTELDSARAELVATARARDEALERAARAKRDASEVARRMQAESEARALAETAYAQASEERDRLDAALVDAEANGGNVDELWTLALADVARTWEVSVCPSPGLASPLEDSDDPLRTAVEIEVDAAREEAGAVVELVWTDEGRPPPAIALRALTIAQALVAQVAKRAEEAELVVRAADDSVDLHIAATDEHGEVLDPSVSPEHRVARGHYRVGAPPA